MSEFCFCTINVYAIEYHQILYLKHPVDSEAHNSQKFIRAPHVHSGSGRVLASASPTILTELPANAKKVEALNTRSRKKTDTTSPDNVIQNH